MFLPPGERNIFSCWHSNGEDIIILLGGHKKPRTVLGGGDSKLIFSKTGLIPLSSQALVVRFLQDSLCSREVRGIH